MKYIYKQHELVEFMKNNGINTTAAFGAPQYFISMVSKRDTDPSHITALDKLNFVEDYLKNHLKDAKKEYLEAIKIVEYRKKYHIKHKEKEALKKAIHTCDCKYCSHKQRKRSHHCHCKYCFVNKNNSNETVDKTDNIQDTKNNLNQNQDTKSNDDSENDTKIVDDTENDTKIVNNTDNNNNQDTINNIIQDYDNKIKLGPVINQDTKYFINIDKNIIILFLIISLMFNVMFSFKIYY